MPLSLPRNRLMFPRSVAVVSDHPERMRQRPTRKRVRAVTLVHDRQGRHRSGVVEVAIIGEQLGRNEHALVDDRSAGHRRRVEIGAGIAVLRANAMFGPLANHEQPPFQRFVGHALPGDEHLTNHGLGGLGDLAQA
jgi:hypothetical protein